MSNLSKLAIAILLGSLVIAIAILFNSFFTSLNDRGNKNFDKVLENIKYINTDDSPYAGNPKAQVVIVEYVDFECPICKKVYDEIMPRLRDEYIQSNLIKFVFKSLPIKDLHPSAMRKTEAAYCAYDQGSNTAFFKYHDELFRRYGTYSNFDLDNFLISIAGEQGLNRQEFGKCLNSGKYQKIIQQDIVEAIAINANGTPTWLVGKASDNKLVDAVKLNGLHEYFVYKTVIDQLLKPAKQNE